MSTTRPRPGRPAVLHLVHSVEHGGTERVLARLAPRLAAEGMRQVVCTQRGLGERAAMLGGQVEVVAMESAARDPLAFRKLARIVRRFEIDVVHARNWGTWADARMGCWSAGRARLILGFHGLQHAAAFTTRQRLRAHLLGFHRARFATVSHSGASQLQRELGVAAGRICVIPNGVDMEQFRPAGPSERRAARAELGLSEGDFVIGCVGNFLSSIKGHAVLVEAFAMLARSIPAARLVLVGQGPLMNDVRRQIAAHRLQGRVVLTGPLADARPALLAMDLYVCPSFAEGMSNALLEAMACGLPCIATDVSDHARMFAPDDASCLVRPGDPAGMAAALGRMIADAGLRATVGARLRATSAREYDFESTVRGYREMYREVGACGAPSLRLARAERRSTVSAGGIMPAKDVEVGA